MKKTIYLNLLFLIVSCGSIRMRDLELDTIQELKGNIKSIEVVTFRYPTEKQDTIVNKDTIYVIFDKKNNITQQIDNYGKTVDKTVYNYNDDMLESTTSNDSDGNILIERYTYDKRKNVTTLNQIQNGELFFSLVSTYDSQNNLTERKRFFPHNQMRNSSDKHIYDYKNRTRTIQTYNENNIASNDYSKYYYDKKGYIIETKTFNNLNKDYITYTKNEYDKFGNLFKRILLGSKNNIINFTSYKNTYDKKGNIITREMYFNNKLLKKTISKIIYR